MPLAMGGFAIGMTKFATMNILPLFSSDLALVSATTARRTTLSVVALLTQVLDLHIPDARRASDDVGDPLRSYDADLRNGHVGHRTSSNRSEGELTDRRSA